MAYQIKKTNGVELLQLDEKVVDKTHAPIRFIGRKVSGYGELENDRVLHLLENFAFNVEPENPILGMLWYNTTERKLNVCVNETGTSKWLPISIINGGSEPTAPMIGELWYDMSESILKVCTAYNPVTFIATWLNVGPLNPDIWLTLDQKTQTVDSVPSNSMSFLFNNNQLVKYEISLLAKDLTDTENVAVWKISGAINVTSSGSTSLVDEPNYEIIGRSGTAETEDWVISISNLSQELVLTVTGTSGTNTIDWLAASQFVML